MVAEFSHHDTILYIVFSAQIETPLKDIQAVILKKQEAIYLL